MIKGKTYGDLLDTGFKVVYRAYGNSDSKIIGFKITWADEFASLMLRQFPKLKVIHVVRDPRSVCASKIVQEGSKYPLLFLIRQWRKLTSFAWINSRKTQAWSDRVLVVKFEDLLTNPKNTTENICKFLNLDFNTNLIHPEKFVDGAGNPWRQNTSYSKAHKGFNSESLKKWQQVLSPEQVELIESLCFSEMLAFGYSFKRISEYKLSPSMVFNPPEISKNDLADWIKPYAKLDPISLLSEMALENWRVQILSTSSVVSDNVKRALCLDGDFFDETRRLVSKYHAGTS